MLLPRMKYGLPLSIARPVAGSNLNSRMPNRVRKRVCAAVCFERVEERIFGRPEAAVLERNPNFHGRLRALRQTHRGGGQLSGDLAGLGLADYELHRGLCDSTVVVQYGLTRTVSRQRRAPLYGDEVGRAGQDQLHRIENTGDVSFLLEIEAVGMRPTDSIAVRADPCLCAG